jgi:hypothetical protein
MNALAATPTTTARRPAGVGRVIGLGQAYAHAWGHDARSVFAGRDTSHGRAAQRTAQRAEEARFLVQALLVLLIWFPIVFAFADWLRGY